MIWAFSFYLSYELKINISILTPAPEIYLTLVIQILQHFFKNNAIIR